jgi:glutaredoxin 2
MSVAALPHDQALRAIELIGRQVVPLVQKELGTSGS